MFNSQDRIPALGYAFLVTFAVAVTAMALNYILGG